MPEYTTKQRKALTEFLAARTDEQLTAKEIADGVEKSGVSVSAVYRNLAKLISEGKLKRIIREGAREAYYQYTDTDCCRGCLHLICKKCGVTSHLEAKDTENFVSGIAKNRKFAVDITDTVLYGVCELCGKSAEGTDKK